VNGLQLRMHRIVSRLGAARSSLVLATVLGLSSLVMMAATAPTTSAATRLYYQRGYYLDAGWMCYGWANGAYHCTHHWSRTSDGHLVSHNVKWVPNGLDASSGASGLFQFLRSTWAGTSYRYASPFNADANIRAAHEVFVRDGYSWREWVCQP
jgi:hypothetical protein